MKVIVREDTSDLGEEFLHKIICGVFDGIHWNTSLIALSRKSENNRGGKRLRGGVDEEKERYSAWVTVRAELRVAQSPRGEMTGGIKLWDNLCKEMSKYGREQKSRGESTRMPR